MANASPRKQARGRRHLPDVPLSSPAVKAVSFNSDVVETSIGGTQTVAKMKGDPLLPVTDGRNLGSQASVPSQSQSSAKSFVRMAKIGEETENKENVVKADESKNSRTKSVQNRVSAADDDAVFASPVGRPAKAALLVKDFEKFTPVKAKVDALRRTTEEYLDQVPDTFKTPPQHQMRRHTLETKVFETPDCYRAVQMETPRKSFLDYAPGTDDSMTDIDEDGEDSCSIMVAVRVRPYSQRELADPNVKRVVAMNGNETTVTSDRDGSVHRFAFDFSFWSFDRDSGDFADQGGVYSSLAQPLLGKAFEGYNTCLFAYGQTGSGKSYSIMGHGKDTGIIPRFCEELFDRAVKASNKDMVKISVEISFFEIYNEKIHDLLASSKEKNGKKATLKVREHPVLGPYVEGLSTFVVNSFEDVEGWITLGTKNRATAATGMNDKSSRSHSVFTLVLTQTKTERVENQDHDHSITSKINLVDLAGSERQSQAQTTGERLREGANINKSLMTLGKVISLLSERSQASRKRKIFIPYRDSVLTWLLKESLGGNSKTAMMATISPSNHHQEETLSTLRYARQTRSIVNLVRVNEDPKAKIIRELRSEIDKLRRQSGGLIDDTQLAGMAEIAMLRDKLTSKEREMDELSRSWQERLRQAEARKQEESLQLEKSGVAAVTMVDNRLPNLVNLNEDPQLSELLLYVIKTGQTRVGRKRPDSAHDIQLSGALIADNHCIINNMEGIINITPIGDAPTYVNGNLITEPTILHHADRVILGGDHYFKFNHPTEVKRGNGKSDGKTTEIKDFEFAKQELLQVQEEKLQAELEEAKRVAQVKMEEELERARREAEQELNQQRSGYEDKLKHMENNLREQSLEVEEAQRSKQEAHTLIQDLRKQKMMLEQEVLAGRKRQQLEAEAAQKVNCDLMTNKSRILELLEGEKVKAASRLAELQQRRAEMTTPGKKRRGGAEGPVGPGIRKDLYKVALLLREANKISQYLKKNLVLSREDVDEEEGEGEGDGGGTQTLIKVTNTHHRIFTHWTVAKLEEKVVQMRDLYQNDGDSSADDDEVFNDPDDTWEKEIPSPSSSPVVTGFHRSPHSSRSAQLNSSNSASPTVSKRVSLGLSTSAVDSDTSSVYKACRKMVSVVMEQLNELSFEETVADKILWDCHILKSSVSAVLEGPQDGVSLPCPPVQLTSGLQLLATHCSLWAAAFDRDSPLVADLLTALTEHVRTVGVHVANLLKGYETDLRSLVQESAGKLSQEVLGVCRTCGQLALATKTRIVRLEQFTQDSASSQLSPEVCQAFLSGCDKLLDRTLQGGIKTLDVCQARADQLAQANAASSGVDSVCKDVSHTVLCTKVLLQACQEVQVEIDMEFTEGRQSTSSSVSSDHGHFFHASYRRLQALLTHVSSLSETATLLVQCTEPLINGDSQDYRRVHRCAELIHKRAQQLLSCTSDYSNTSLSSSSTVFTSSLLADPHLNSTPLRPSVLPRPSAPGFKSSVGDSVSSLGSSGPILRSSATDTVSLSSLRSSAPGSRSSDADSVFRSVPGSRPSAAESVSLLSESQTEHLDFAAQEVLSSATLLMTGLLKLTSPERRGSGGPMTPRGKRILPVVSPEKVSASPMVHLRRASVRCNVALASTALDS